MSPVFRINFRREAFRRQRAEARARVVGLVVWLTYFGVIVVLLGLYVLNAVSLAHRTDQIERHAARQRANPGPSTNWRPSPDEAGAVLPWLDDSGRWRDLFTRLAVLTPNDAHLTLVQWNPDDISGGERRLLVSGVLRPSPTSDPMARVTGLVDALGRDSLFTAHFHSVRLVSTRTRDDGQAEFQVECR